MNQTQDAISITEITKSFGATTALNKASLTIRAGVVHAILGENGAGKSTLIKILSGLIRPNEGDYKLLGQSVHFDSPLQAQKAGVATAFQELSLVPDMSVAENLSFPSPPTRLGLICHGQVVFSAVKRLAAFGITDIDVRKQVRDLDLSVKQKLEIVLAMSRNPKVLLLDEPTSALASKDVEWLGEQIKCCKERGMTIILITHRMPEVRAFCDELSVLRNGSFVGSFKNGAVNDKEIFKLVMGRSMGAAFPARKPEISYDISSQPVLAGSHLAGKSELKDFSFELRQGECLGVVGLQGMGQLELFYGLFGIDPFERGELRIGSHPATIDSPLDAVAAGVGLSLVPEERKTEGLALDLSGRINVSLPTISRFAKWGWIDQHAEISAVSRALQKVRGNQRALIEPASAFSGGNQQKLVIAKWLLAESRAMLLFDPTRGVDVGAKLEIYEMIHAYIEEGGAVLFHSTEIPEIVNMCDRVLVLYEGRLVAEFEGRRASEEQVTTAMLGETPAHDEHKLEASLA